MAEKPASNPSRAYDDWFTATSDPWDDVARLTYGSDSTAATTLQRLILQSEPNQLRALETKLLRVLAHPQLTDLGRMWACRMLAMVGSTACVAPLAPLLSDERTADAARFALDQIDDPAVNEAYRAALGKLNGAAKAGLIGSIALRGDAGAVEALRAIRQTETETADVRTAAARALERLTAKERTAPL